MGANSQSSVFYNRIKGEMEQAVSALGYDSVVFARPSLLDGDRESLKQAARPAERIGLANRVVPDGTSRAAAIALAHELSALPQTCLRNDRRSAYEQCGLTFDAALANEFTLGMHTLEHGEAQAGAARFAAGAGRHGGVTT